MAASQIHSTPKRIAIFGVTGQLGQELVDSLDEAEWPIAELIGVASADSVGETFEFAGRTVDVVSDWPALKGIDLVYICTRGPEGTALEVVRECLRAEVACVDLTGALADQSEVAMPLLLRDDEEVAAPLITVPTATTLSWAKLAADWVGIPKAGLTRIRGTVLTSAAAQGRAGVTALSEESIALFNQSETPKPGPVGQAVAFDVVPGDHDAVARTRRELQRVFGPIADLELLQVPAFVGEGSALGLEFAEPISRDQLIAVCHTKQDVEIVREGPGSRGLAAVDDEAAEPVGPTMRDAAGQADLFVGRIERDESFDEDAAAGGDETAARSWRLWMTVDPLRLVAAHAIRVGARRLGLDAASVSQG